MKIRFWKHHRETRDDQDLKALKNRHMELQARLQALEERRSVIVRERHRPRGST